MNRRVAVALVLMLAGLGASFVYAPRHDVWVVNVIEGDPPPEVLEDPPPGPPHIAFEWWWSEPQRNVMMNTAQGLRYERNGESVYVTWAKCRAYYWPLLAPVQTCIVLVGGGLLTWVVWRERRRRAAPDTVSSA